MPRMRTRAYNAKKRMFSNMDSYNASNDYPLMRGIVVENNDPLEIGRVKVRIYSLHGTAQDGTRDEDLPWAYPAFFSASYDSGTFIIPEVNNAVWLLFEDGNVDKPVYIGGAYGKGVKNPKQVGNTNGEYRSQRIGKNERPAEVSSVEDKVLYKSPKGAKIIIREVKGEEQVIISDQLGQVIEMKAPFKPECSIANLENIDKLKLLDGEAEVSLTTVNGSTMKVLSTEDNTRFSINLIGSNPISASGDTSSEGTEFYVGNVTIKIGVDEVTVRTPTEQVNLSGGEIRLKAPRVYIDAEDVYLGGEG